mmetsp:Transcript_70369/g.139566  ORF Transcript_70369/g.139566 Transcript_70369/m.139566 type:complete len:717 (+) Transcript_70369:98-2248(+)
MCGSKPCLCAELVAANMMRTVIALLAVTPGLEAIFSSDLRHGKSSNAADVLACLQVTVDLQHSKLSQQLGAPENRTRLSTPTPLRRMNLLFKGYNAFYGDPFSTTEMDEGFMRYAGKPIFKTSYDQKHVTSDGHHLVPDGLSLSPVQHSCTGVSVISAPRRTDRLDAMSAFVVEEGGGRAPGWFAASTDFRVSEDMETRRLRPVIVLSECAVFNVSIDVLEEKLQPSAAFLERARDLPDTFEASDYFAFFDEFGTHVMSTASLGALAGVSTFLDENSFNLELKKGSVGSKGDLGRFRNSNGRVVGRLQRGEVPLTSSGNTGAPSLASEWAQAAREAPVTLRVDLKSICSVLNRSDVAVPAIRIKHCYHAARGEEYCMRHVMPREGLNPEICVKDTGAGADRECLWDSDCVPGAFCQGRSCRHYDNFIARGWASIRGEGKALFGNSTDENFKTLVQFEQAQFSYFLNMGVFIPWGLLAIPLGIISFRLTEIENEKDKIYTAEDDNLRHTEISSIGISGVALLRRPSDRRWAIRCAFVSLLLQVAFLYFIIVYDFAFLFTKGQGHAVFIRTPVLLFCGVLVNALSCCSIMISGSKMWHTAAPEGYEDIHRILVALDSFIIPAVCIIAGTLYLCTANGIMSLVFSSTALHFVVSFNARFAGLLSWSLSVHGGRAFKPTEVLIKDDVDSMTYAQRSLIFSFSWAMLTVIIGCFLVSVLQA